MDELDLARQMAEAADEISMRYFAKRPDFALKADGTPVTAADREIETMIRDTIRQRFPGHSILGEEEGLQGTPNSPVWIIDPIDGTANFAAGIPIFATLIGFRVNGRTEAGIASAPALGERYEAAAGDGARLNGEPIKVSSVSVLEEAAVCFGSLRRMIRHGYGLQVQAILEKCKRDRGLGDFWGHLLVARGAVDAMAEPSLEPWDVIPLEVIVREAGGTITDLQGLPYPEESVWAKGPLEGCLSTNGALHDEMVAVLSGADRSY